MPSGRCRPLAFGMNTRLTGLGFHGSARRCNQSANSAFDWGSSAVLPSMPAVLRPALTSVTRRTLNSALARERSINFCKLRTLARSPACDAVKILCRRRRTSSSTCRQSIDNQSGISSSGPFAAATAGVAACAASRSSLPWRPTCPSVPVSSIFESSQAHLATSAPFRVRASPVSGRLSGTDGGGAAHLCPGFLLPFGRRHWLLGHPVPAEGSAFLTVGPPASSAAGPRRGFHVPHE